MTIPAIILIGPTGAGKSPLGEYLQHSGLGNTPVAHFDFGHHLRGIVAGDTHLKLKQEDIRLLTTILREGRLLEADTFYLARAVLNAFIAHCLSPGGLLLMNGLPRHVGQAEELDDILEVRGVLHMTCSLQTVYERLRQNSGGDRTHRTDDHRSLVARKLDTYLARTRPLVDFYRCRDIPVYDLPVSINSTPETLLQGELVLRVASKINPL